MEYPNGPTTDIDRCAHSPGGARGSLTATAAVVGARIRRSHTKRVRHAGGQSGVIRGVDTLLHLSGEEPRLQRPPSRDGDPAHRVALRCRIRMGSPHAPRPAGGVVV